VLQYSLCLLVTVCAPVQIVSFGNCVHSSADCVLTGSLYSSKVKFKLLVKGKGLPQQPEQAQGISGRLRPLIFLKFGTTRVIGHQPYAPAAFTPGEIPGTHL
jgi:hypothetical protein